MMLEEDEDDPKPGNDNEKLQTERRCHSFYEMYAYSGESCACANEQTYVLVRDTTGRWKTDVR